uniref:NADP-dependent oxidoreductase n=1 Tax=Paractinoplanes polyasparticus TaxID=2856853 RepID=UPI001C8591CA|nr:NADP-dependent oxidoreductase [Actinoplanes polyasparticus]
MRAVIVPAPGKPAEIADIPTPVPAAGQVLIRVHAAALNPMDNVLAAGALAPAMEHRYPLTLGRDVAGTIEALGPDVTGLSIGDAVIGHIGFQAPFQAGTLAEYAVVDARTVALKPATLDDATAAALPLAAGAALAIINAAGLQSGQSVLICGASGGVGRYAVQLAAQRGATVLATATPATAERLRELGAHTIIDYTTAPITDQVRTLYPDGVDVLLNLWATNPHDVPLTTVRPGGTVSTITGTPDADTATTHGLHSTGMTIANPDHKTLTELAHHAATGTLHTDITRTLPLADAIDGLRQLATGPNHGKIVITIS